MNAPACPRCGRVLTAAARFCTGCGAPVVAVASAPARLAAASAPAGLPRPVAIPSGGKRLAPALFLHCLYPGLGFVYAEALGLALAHILINTVGIGIGLVLMVQVFKQLLNQPWLELGQLILLLVALLLLWGQGLAATKRAVERFNADLAAGRPAGAQPGRVVAMLVWELLALVTLTGYLMLR